MTWFVVAVGAVGLGVYVVGMVVTMLVTTRFCAARSQGHTWRRPFEVEARPCNHLLDPPYAPWWWPVGLVGLVVGVVPVGVVWAVYKLIKRIDQRATARDLERR